MSDPVASNSTASDKPPESNQPASANDVFAATPARDMRPKIGDSRPAPAANAESDGRDARPRIGDSRPAPAAGDGALAGERGPEAKGDQPRKRRRRGGRGRGGGGGGGQAAGGQGSSGPSTAGRSGGDRTSGGGGGGRSAPTPVEARLIDDDPIQLDEKTLKRRRGRERKGRPVGRYLMCVSVRPNVTQIAVLEGRSLVEHYVSRPSDEVTEIHGNIYLGRVQNVLPGMEAAFVDIGTPKNAVLYRGDVQYDTDDIEAKSEPRIEQLLQAKQKILCQVTKNPIAHKGARLTQEVSLPGRFVVLIPNSATIGISKRLPDNERRRLRNLLDKVRPQGHGLILRTAAENVSADEIERDVNRLVMQWNEIDKLANTVNAPALLYREPDMALRVIREEFNADYRGVVIDDEQLFEQVRDYVSAISPALTLRAD